KQYVLFQENVVHIENQDRFLSNEKTPVFWNHHAVERHAAAIYTRGIYLKFLTELVNATAFKVIEIEKDKVYDLKKHIRYEKPEFTRETFRVHVDLTTGSFKCFCGKFERDGIVCCHILRLFTQFDITHIPDKLIVERWTISFREKELDKCKKEMVLLTGEDQSHNVVRYAILMSKVGEACSDIS
uniref:Protein FAR1-RELATED SEQUENCE n=1 Tax=Triticum urartu TaxID=4572 RepID=A0A8R7K222_TRIUA